MPKKSVDLPVSGKWPPTIDDLILLFESRRRLSNLKSAESPDPSMPRIPYAVVPVESDDPNVVAHFIRFYRDPVGVEGKLTLTMPDSVRPKPRRMPLTKKPNASKR